MQETIRQDHVSNLPPTSSLRLFILVEEAHNILLKHLQGYETVMEMVLRQVREYGVSICLLDQHPSLISIPARGTYTTIAFSLPAYEDIKAMADGMALGGDAVFLTKLRVGQAIVKLKDRYLNPFLLQVPKADSIPKIVHLHPWIYYEFARIKEIVESSSSDPVRVVPAKLSSPSSKKEGYSPTTEVIPLEKTESGVISSIPKRNLRFLVDVGEYPITITSHRYHRLRLSPKQGNQIRRELLKGDLVRPVDINTGRARVRLYELTGAGEQVLREQGYSTRSSGRKGSLEHQYWCKHTKNYFERKGYGVLEEVEIEKGKAVDLVAIKSHEKIAVEVETGKSDILANVQKCLRANFTQIIIFPTSTSSRNKVAEILKANRLLEEISIVEAADIVQ